jgi:hypothetical protein
MRTFKPWTLVARRLAPALAELHAATPWRIPNKTRLSDWFYQQTWQDLHLGDSACKTLCLEPPRLPTGIFDPRSSAPDSPEVVQIRDTATIQLAHRLLFAADFAAALPPRFRTCLPWTGNFSTDAHTILVSAWRSDAAEHWALRFGHRYGGLPR